VALKGLHYPPLPKKSLASEGWDTEGTPADRTMEIECKDGGWNIGKLDGGKIGIFFDFDRQ